MIAKCNLCGNTFNAQRSTAKFCCDLHRTLFGKLSTEEKVEKLKQLDTSLKSGSEIPVSEKGQTKNSYSWVEEIEKYCGSEGILPEDLIKSYKERNKSVKKSKGVIGSNEEEITSKGINQGKESKSFWFSDYRKKKLGL